MNFQLDNTYTPNSVPHTCVFSCFEADDTATNLHVALDRFRTEALKVFLSGDYDFLCHIYGYQIYSWNLAIQNPGKLAFSSM